MVIKKIARIIKKKLGRKQKKEIADPKFKEWPHYWISDWEKSHDFKRFGYRFIQSFKHSFFKGRKHIFLLDLCVGLYESPLAVGLMTSKSKYKGQLGVVKISFKKNEIIINAIQGLKGVSEELREFEQIVGMPWANCLVIEIENQARENGYHLVKIIVPERQRYFEKPLLSEKIHKKIEELRWPGTFDEAGALKKREIAKIRERMKKLYYGVAQSLGYKKQGNFFVKRL